MYIGRTTEQAKKSLLAVENLVGSCLASHCKNEKQLCRSYKTLIEHETVGAEYMKLQVVPLKPGGGAKVAAVWLLPL